MGWVKKKNSTVLEGMKEVEVSALAGGGGAGGQAGRQARLCRLCQDADIGIKIGY